MPDGGRFWADHRETAVAPYVERADRETKWLDYRLSSAAGAVNAALGLRLWSLKWRARAIVRRSAALEALDDAALQQAALALRPHLLRRGFEPALVVDAFALIRAATCRHLGLRHHPVQLIGGLAMLEGRLAQMATGEGKTITALLPAITAALAGMPVHVVTVNDYLAARDAEKLAPVYAALGLTVGLAQHDDTPEVRRAAYEADVTYVTNKELTFDYLRDRVARGTGRQGEARLRLAGLLAGHRRAPPLILRGLHFAVIDEADSVLIDEARTPLIISAERDAAETGAQAETGLMLARALVQGIHWRRLAAERRLELTEAGRDLLAAQAGSLSGLWRIARAREEMVQQALSALHLFERDRDYIIADDTVQIVDEFTGRVMPDRSWEGGLHQMIEVKEGVPVTGRRETLARITYQRFFRRYRRLAAMTGTGREVAGELHAEFDLPTLCIPTNRPVLRRDRGLRLWRDAARRWADVIRSVRAETARGRPVLIGTRSVEASELIGRALAAAGLDHAVLNARQDAQEAAIIAAAGQPGRVTVATNMAGRGTDILLSAEARAAGGLHVILTEFHESARIDRQLYGRAGRQGDPGSCEAIVALDDELFCRFLPGWMRRSARALFVEHRLPSPVARLLKHVAQQRAERQNFLIRRDQVKTDHALARALAFTGPTE